MIEFQVRMPRLFAEGAGELQVQLRLEKGSLNAIYGPSGAGKTTLLRILAGLETPLEGEIMVNGATWLDTSKGVNQPVQQRSIGFVFQDSALFPNLTVRQNLAYASSKKQDAFVDELLMLTGLESLSDRRPSTLSGGQRQRVALARALVRRPAVLLLDEPFSALDAAASQLVREELLRLHRFTGTTTLLVSHNQEDIRHLADRRIYLEQGLVKGDQSLFSEKNRAKTERVLRIDRTANLITTESFQLTIPLDDPAWNGLQVGDEVVVDWKVG